MAQTILGYFYSTSDYMDLDKAFHWHTEACQNGSVESQGKKISRFNENQNKMESMRFKINSCN